jgi:hypothetical protein
MTVPDVAKYPLFPDFSTEKFEALKALRRFGPHGRAARPLTL